MVKNPLKQWLAINDILVRGCLHNSLDLRDMSDKRGKCLLQSDAIYKIRRMITFLCGLYFREKKLKMPLPHQCRKVVVACMKLQKKICKNV